MNQALGKKLAQLETYCDGMDHELTMLKQLLDMREYALRNDFLFGMADVFDHPLQAMAESLAASVSDIKLIFQEEFLESSGLD